MRERSSHPSLPPRHGLFSRAQKNSRNVIVDRRSLCAGVSGGCRIRGIVETFWNRKIRYPLCVWPREFSFRERGDGCAGSAGGNRDEKNEANWKREGYMIYGRLNRIFVRLWTSFGRRGTRLKGSSTLEWNFSAIRENLTAAEGGVVGEGWLGESSRWGDGTSGESSNFVLRRSLFRLIREEYYVPTTRPLFIAM